jgi:hypothetical protein
MICNHCKKELDNTLLEILLHERDCSETPANRKIMKVIPEELRLGNRVIYNGYEAVVCGIQSPATLEDKRYSDKYLVEIYLGGGITTVTIDEIEPIPLTGEILEKFGFKKLDKYTFNKGGWFVYNRKRGFVTGSKNRELKLDSVHELQNWWFTNNKEDLKIKIYISELD